MKSCALNVSLCISFCVCICLCEVQISKNGVPWMCNIDPEQHQTISALPTADQQLIYQLEQVHVFHRHGARVSSHPISRILPKANIEYECNISTVETRQFKHHNFYPNSSQSFVDIRKMYPQNEQIVEGNCASGQSIHDLIPQHQANGRHLLQRYIGNESYHLFNAQTLSTIRDNLRAHSTDNRIKLTSTEFERTIASLMVIVSTIFFQNANVDNVIINTEVYDGGHDPFDYYSECYNSAVFKEWEGLFNSDPLRMPNDIMQTPFALNTISQFEAEGGVWLSKSTGHELLYPYCAGLALPLTNDTFWNSVQLSYDIDTAFVDTDYAKNKSECFDNFQGSPILNQIFQNIIQMKKHSFPKLLIHSVHDWTIVNLLKALAMFDHELVMFAEMVTLEIYSDLNDTELYWFRWTRKGEFVPFPGCDYEDGDTQLCDLDVMIERSFQNIVSNEKWLEQCLNVMNDCRCGYCTDAEMSTTSVYSSSASTRDTADGNRDANGCANGGNDFNIQDSNFWYGAGIGAVFGMGFIGLLAVIIDRTCCGNRAGYIHSKYLLENESYQL